MGLTTALPQNTLSYDNVSVVPSLPEIWSLRTLPGQGTHSPREGEETSPDEVVAAVSSELSLPLSSVLEALSVEDRHFRWGAQIWLSRN